MTLGNENVKLKNEIRAEANGIWFTKSELRFTSAFIDRCPICGSMIENSLESSTSPTHFRFSKIVSMEWPQFTAKLSYELTTRGNNRWRNKTIDNRVISLGNMFFFFR
jgi:hypothetical protein